MKPNPAMMSVLARIRSERLSEAFSPIKVAISGTKVEPDKPYNKAIPKSSSADAIEPSNKYFSPDSPERIPQPLHKKLGVKI